MSKSVTAKVEAEVSIYAVNVNYDNVDFDVVVDRDGDIIINAELTEYIAREFLECKGYTPTRDD